MAFETIRRDGQDVEVPLTSYETRFLNDIRGVQVESKFDNKGNMRLWTQNDYFVKNVTIVMLTQKINHKLEYLWTTFDNSDCIED